MIALSQCPGIDPVKDSSAALQAALNLKQPITWDCPVNCVMGTDATKGIFVPDGSAVTFTQRGRLDVDSIGFPALAFMHAAGVWTDTKIRYVGTPSTSQPTSGSAWTNGPAKNYLLQNGLNPSFTGVGGTLWTSPTNTAALISVRGASNVTLQGLKIYVDDDAPASQFALVGLGIDAAYAPGAPATPTAACVAPTVAVTDFVLDGVLMGAVGGGNQVSFERIERHRYADLQDAAGIVAGAGTGWFAPPHWIYLQGSLAMPLTLSIRDAVDLAKYRGSPARRPTGTGYANSIKVELCNGSLLENIYLRCPDGGLGILANGSTVGGKVRNVTCVVDSSLRSSDGKPCSTGGVFFPSAHPYPASDIDVTVRDLAGGWPVQGNPAPLAVNLRLTVQR